jgi:hypothetical protein
MKRHLLLFAVLLFWMPMAVAAQQCICTAGCDIASDPFPPGPNQPTACTLTRNGVIVGSFPVVLSSTIPLSNAASCMPASATYVPGPVGSVACLMTLPPLVPGTYTLTASAGNAAGVSPASAPFVFDSVAALPTIPIAPANLRRK